MFVCFGMKEFGVHGKFSSLSQKCCILVSLNIDTAVSLPTATEQLYIFIHPDFHH